MATVPHHTTPQIEYPCGDGKPMSETELHMWVTMDLIQALAHRYDDDPMVYVCGDLLMYYEEGEPNKRLAPDVFVVKGVPKKPVRDNFLIWEEGKGPDMVIEITSKTTRANDQNKKFKLYRDVLKVPEYFQFDPTEDYLRPPFQGFRLKNGVYLPIKPVAGRLPSLTTGLHLERDGTQLRLYDPINGEWLRTSREEYQRAEAEAAKAQAEATKAQAEAAKAQAEAAKAQAEAAKAQAEAARADLAEAENQQLRREIEEFKRRLAEGKSL